MKINTITSFQAYKAIRKPLPKPSIRFSDKKKYSRNQFKKWDWNYET